MYGSNNDVISQAVEKMNPLLVQLEEQRQYALSQRATGFKYIWILVACCVPAVFFGIPGIFLGAVTALLGSFIIYSKYCGSHKKNYEQDFKQRVLTQLTKEVQPGLEYRPFEGLPEHVFRSASLHSGDIDRYETEDLFCGKIGDTDVWFAEVKVEDKRTRTDSDGKTETYWVTIFDGVLFVADFHKHFSTDVSVMPDVGEKHFGWFGKMMQNIGGNVVRLENPEFEREFVVRGGDQVEARYLLTPDMQDRIMQLRRVLGSSLRMAFRHSQLYLTFDCEDNWFEPNFNASSHDYHQLSKFVREMQCCCSIVEELNLNTRIWTKE